MSSPVPEFRDAHQYWQPLLNNDIIRPKPRRLGDMSNSPTQPSIQRATSRERLFVGNPLKTYEKDSESGPKGSVASVSKSASRETLCHQNSGGSARTPSKEVLCNSTTSPGSRESTPVITAYPRSTSKDKSKDYTHKSESDSSLHQTVCQTPNKDPALPTNVRSGCKDIIPITQQLRSASRSSCPGSTRAPSKETAVGGTNSLLENQSRTPCKDLIMNNRSNCKTPNKDYIANSCNNSDCSSRSSREPQHQMTHAKSSPGLISRASPASLLSDNQTLEKDSRCHPAFWEHKDVEEDEFSPDGYLSPYMDSMSNTDCGSLSKSSSDGDPVICRKRPPTRLKSKRRNILSFPQVLGLDDSRLIQRRHECYGGSSSDENNRSSGHASMSDGQSSYLSSSPTDGVLSRSSGRTSGKGTDSYNSDSARDDSRLESSEHRFGRGTPLKSVPEDERLLTSHHVSSTKISCRRPTSSRKAQRTPAEGSSGADDLQQAIEQLSVWTHGSRTSYSTSTYSSVSGSESEPVRRLIRHSSLETINTNITSADEFVWVDNHTRLVELQRVPWSNHDILKVMQNGRLREHLGQISMETVPRLAYLLQRPLVRIARETQRFSKTLGMCTKQEVSGSLKVVLSPALADSCIKACHRAAAMSAVSGDQMKLSKSARAGLQLSVGRFHRWMCDVRIGSFVHQYAAIYLTAAIENLLEEIVLQCMSLDGSSMFTAIMLETAISNSSDLWGLFQPFSHLNAGRTATGALSLPRWPSQSDNSSSRPGSSVQLHLTEEQSRQQACKSVEQHLLTTCVGSITELGDLLRRVVQYYQHMQGYNAGRCSVVWGPAALHALYYFMRCSQLEHAEHGNHRSPVQELVYERPYLVLPPLIEWVRVASAHCEHRRSQVVDKDDVMQAARLLLPGVDCPIREFGIYDDRLHCRKRSEDPDCARMLKIELAFRMLASGRTDFVPHALQLLPASHVNTFNEQGLTPLMMACIRGDEAMVHMLLDAGADVDLETPSPSSSYPYVNPETQHWTAVTYATTHGHLSVIKLLLEKGANVEGGARLSEEKITVTPLQLAAASGRLKLAELLLLHGAHPFLSTTLRDSLAYGGAAQRGCYSAIAVAGAHGQRTMLHLLLSHPMSKSNKDVLSLEEILAEGASQLTCDRRTSRLQIVPVCVEDLNKSSSSVPSAIDNSQVIKLTKTELKSLQEAMYHSAENGHIDITLDLRNIGVPWTLHCWMNTLAMAYELQVEPVIDQLLQDYLQVWPEDCSSQFVDECLPLLFTIFRHSKKEGTSLLLADIFSNCYSKEPIKEIRDVPYIGGARIDPTYVNNPEMSDVQFRVEGRVFYAHKIILVNASPRFKSMLSTKFSEGVAPVVQINDIRYDIFQLVMQYLYKGGFENCEIDQNDVLELMAAASFFQLDGLLRFCESRSSKLVDLDNVVSMYIHAKIYNAVYLLEYCQGFLLQNMVALLTYDDSVRKLIFGKKLHNHDVLSGLLLTLQTRVREKSSINKSVCSTKS